MAITKNVAIATAMHLRQTGDGAMTGTDWLGIVLIIVFMLFMAYSLSR